VREHAVHRLDHYERDVEAYSDRESEAEVARSVMMVTVMVAVVVVMLLVRHG